METEREKRKRKKEETRKGKSHQCYKRRSVGVLDSKKSSLSPTYKKNSEVNNKVCDLNQRTVAALDRLAEVYETFEDTWDIVEKESAEGDLLCASEEDAVDKLEAAAPDRTLEMLEDCRKSMDSAFREFRN